MMYDYTGEDVRRFKAIVAALRADRPVDSGVSLRFIVFGWLEVISARPGVQLTELGREVLDG